MIHYFIMIICGIYLYECQFLAGLLGLLKINYLRQKIKLIIKTMILLNKIFC